MRLRTTRRRTAALAVFAGLAGLVTASASLPAAASLLVYEPFDYPFGTQLAGVPATGTNLAGDYQGGGGSEPFRLTVVAPGAGYGSLVGAPSARGGRMVDTLGATPGLATVALDEAVSIAPGESLYWSALFTFDDSSNRNHFPSLSLLDDATGDQISFGEPVVGARNIRVATTTSSTGGQVAAGQDDLFSDGQTFLLIGRYTNSTSSLGDTLDLLGYDTALPTELPSLFDPSDPGLAFALSIADLDIDLEQITTLSFSIRGNGNNFIDELRIGEQWVDVVPEPSTTCLLGLGLAALAVCRGRARPDA